MSALPKTSPQASDVPSSMLGPPAGDFNLRNVILGLAQVESDPYRITSLLIEALTPEQKDAALMAALPNYVQVTLSVPAMRKAGGHSTKGQPAPQSRGWDNVKALRGEVALLRASVFARGEWKALGDCDRDDCMDIAGRRDKRASEIAAQAERYRELVAAMKRRRAATVRDLPVEVVEGIFNA